MLASLREVVEEHDAEVTAAADRESGLKEELTAAREKADALENQLNVCTRKYAQATSNWQEKLASEEDSHEQEIASLKDLHAKSILLWQTRLQQRET